MNIKICVTGNKMYANSRLLCYVVTISSIILVSRVQFAQAQASWACPVQVGKLGPMLKTNVTLELCTFDNRTSPSTSSCSKPQSGECLRGEHTLLNFIYKRHNTSLYRRLSAMSYGGEICFAYDTYYDDDYDTPYDTSDPFLGCKQMHWCDCYHHTLAGHKKIDEVQRSKWIAIL